MKPNPLFYLPRIPALLMFLTTALIPIRTAAATSPKPNVVMILTDDQGWGDLSINGNQSLQTPHIDQLAREGASFDRFYVCPVCSPTRAELLTGRYHLRGGVTDVSRGGERLDLDETTIGEVFKKAGYATAAYGKWHNGMQPPYHPNSRGFDDFYGFCSGHWGLYHSPVLEHNGQIVRGNGFIIDDLTDHGIQFIEQNRGRPFFLYLPFNTPHSPMQVPDRFWNKFKDSPPVQSGTQAQNENTLHTRAALAMCENIDWNVGRLLRKLDDLGLTENTIVVYLSDNGPNGHRWNGGMKGIKGSTDEGGVRSPLFIRWNGVIRPNLHVKPIAGAIDLLPTLADLAGIGLPAAKPLDGISLEPLLTGPPPAEWPDRIIFSHWRNRVSARNQQFRLDHEGRLYDMLHDPDQRKDVYAQFPEIAESMIQAQDRWFKEVTTELGETGQSRPFTIGDPQAVITQLPARDAAPHGGIERSNRYPNCSFLKDWTSTEDTITWNVEVLADGDFDVEIYYTCPPESVGTILEVSLGDARITATVTESHDPPLVGQAFDRVPRAESYVKDFRPLNAGAIHLKKGEGTLQIKALEIPNKEQAIDFRMLILTRKPTQSS